MFFVLFNMVITPRSQILSSGPWKNGQILTLLMAAINKAASAVNEPSLDLGHGAMHARGHDSEFHMTISGRRSRFPLRNPTTKSPFIKHWPFRLHVNKSL